MLFLCVQIQRVTPGISEYWICEWNADQNIQCFWWLYGKVVVNSILREAGWKGAPTFVPTGEPLILSAIVLHDVLDR